MRGVVWWCGGVLTVLLCSQATSAFKHRLYNVDTKAMRRTVNAPLFGGPPTRMVLMPGVGETDGPVMAYANETQVGSRHGVAGWLVVRW